MPDMSDPSEQIFQIRTHLLYELKWLVHAASRFAEARKGDPSVALLDSATLHARNLFEFAAKGDKNAFTLNALGGERQQSGAWDKWANQYVTHMHFRESQRSGYPAGVSPLDPERLMKMADAVLVCLERGAVSISDASVKQWYENVVGDVRAYWRDPTPKRHEELHRHYDGSRDPRPY